MSIVCLSYTKGKKRLNPAAYMVIKQEYPARKRIQNEARITILGGGFETI